MTSQQFRLLSVCLLLLIIAIQLKIRFDYCGIVNVIPTGLSWSIQLGGSAAMAILIALWQRQITYFIGVPPGPAPLRDITLKAEHASLCGGKAR